MKAITHSPRAEGGERRRAPSAGPQTFAPARGEWPHVGEVAPHVARQACACGGGCPRCESENRRAVLQPKLRVSTPGDASEREADRVAEAVLSAPRHDATNSRAHGDANAPAHVDTTNSPARGETSAGVRVVQSKRVVQPKHAQGAQSSARVTAESSARVTAAAESGVEALRGGGEPLPASSREFFEARFGRDFGGVRVHTGAAAAASARTLGARAYTVGGDVVFGAGEYAPESEAGRRLLAHELAHVVQQRAGGETLIQRETITGCTDPEQIHVTDAVTRAYSDLGAVLKLMDWQPKGKGKDQDQGEQKEYRPSVKNAMWLAFRTDDPEETEKVADKLAGLRSGITGAEYKCVRQGQSAHAENCKPTEDAYVVRDSPDRHSKRSGPIHLCTPQYFAQPDAEQARIVIHEAAHRFLYVPDTGYFLPGCAESPAAAAGKPADDAESGTAGDNPSVRLDNADAYACFVHYLTRVRRQELQERAESYRGAGLAVEYAELTGDGSVVYTRIGSPGMHTYRIAGEPANSGFRYRWYLEAGNKTYPVESAFGKTVDAAVFGETNTRVIIPDATRKALARDGATSGKLVCEIELYGPAAGGPAARPVKRDYSLTIRDAVDDSNLPAQQPPAP